MRVLIVFDHPYLQSYCAAMMAAVQQGAADGGHEVEVIDLYRDGFAPVMSIEELEGYAEGRTQDPKVTEYQRKIEQADHLVFIFPVWWQVMPALTKGFLDRVLLPPWAFEETKGIVPKGKLTHLSATVLTTMGFPHWYYRLHFANALAGALLRGSLRFVGIRRYRWLNLGNVGRIPDSRRKRHLERIRARFSRANL
ncbi:MAG: NAD(P)H-dependent oxidoreductase [Alkalispirochaetaceae bacterium]